MRRILLTLLILFATYNNMVAQFGSPQQRSADGSFDHNISPMMQQETNGAQRDSTKKDDEIPIGMHVWTVDRQFGDVTPATPDTLPHTYRNTLFTWGEKGEYNTTGNQGSPRIARIFTDRDSKEQFIFSQPFDYFVVPIEKHHFTNTFSPITNLSYNSCGNKTNGEDHLKALFAVNVNKRLGFGFKFDYIYARGYYQNQSNSHFNYTLHSSYLGDKYDMHFLFSTNHQKITENGGITDDNYITHPESFSAFEENEIPVVLTDNWNRHDNHHIFLTHRYKVGFKKKVPMTEDEIKAKKFAMASQQENENVKRGNDVKKKGKIKEKNEVFAGRPDDAVIKGDLPDEEKKDTTRIKVDVNDIDSLLATKEKKDTSWTKDEFVPVTSFIHTLEWNYNKRIYQAYRSPQDYYADTFYNRYHGYGNDSIYDDTRYYNIRNTLGIALLEGFNKYAKAGLKVFLAHELRDFTLPDTLDRTASYKENALSVGAVISKTQGTLLHYTLKGETWLAGEDAGQLRLQGVGDLNFKLFNDTIQLVARAMFEHNNPTFYYRHYHSKHLWWDNDLDKEIHTKVEGELSLKRTRTRLRFAVDNLNNYTYFKQTYNILENNNFRRTGNTVEVCQSSKNISVITAQLNQDFTFGAFNWENTITYQTSTDKDIIPVPALNIFSNMYFRFLVSKVLDIHLGADVRYFTKYYAPDYSPTLGQFAVQGNETKTEIGNYPWVNVYADFFLKHARFFVMYTHVNKGGSNNYFLTPHYPTNSSILRFGVSWNFFN
ncbi:MAG: putative porin [Bacteroidaceae bacterium]|nr:putative porin [Bacteroidaceae bacterium]